jgi:hypothetical protein
MTDRIDDVSSIANAWSRNESCEVNDHVKANSFLHWQFVLVQCHVSNQPAHARSVD